MTMLKVFFVASLAMILSSCATVGPAPAVVDTNVSAMVDTDGLRATLRVLLRSEADRVFGDRASAQLGVVELNVENRGATPVSVERMWIRIVTQDGKDIYPLSPFNIANLARPGSGMISTGSSVVDAIQLAFGVAKLTENYDYARKWDHLMPHTFNVAAGEERRLLLAFPTPHWAPGLWRLELPLSTEAGAVGPQLSIPLTFKAMARPPG